MYGDGSFYGDDALDGDSDVEARAPLTSVGVQAMDEVAITRKQGDTWPFIEEQLVDQDGAALDLEDCTVTVTMSTTLGVVVIDDAACTVTDARGGYVRYEPAADDFATVGTYRLEFKVVRPDDSIVRVPTGGIDDEGERIAPYRIVYIVKHLQ